MHLSVPRRLAAAAALALPLVSAVAAEQSAPPATQAESVPLADRGFSYFMGFGGQRVRYQETGSLFPFRSKATATSPLLVTGALYEVSENLLFSMDSETTFAPRSATETWRSTVPVFEGIPLTDPVLQRNGFSLSQSLTQLLAHRRLVDAVFATAGLSFRTLSFKRFSFVAGPDNAVGTPAGATVEEAASEVLLNVGGEWETERVRAASSHHTLRATVGLPLWRRLTNTSQPQMSFDNIKGFDLALEGRTSLAVRPNVHLGLWGKWHLSKRGRELIGNQVELPRSQLDTVSLGVELLWKL